jgi:NADH:ubiquinone oxidoreductase subunit E
MNGQHGLELERLEPILAHYPATEASLIQVLQDVQRTYHYLPCEVLERVADRLDVPLARVFSVSTFYRAFALSPQGETTVQVCTGTACHIRGAWRLLDELDRELHVGPGETTHDRRFTVRTVNCLGACALAPVLVVGDQYHGNAKPARLRDYLAGEGGNDAD